MVDVFCMKHNFRKIVILRKCGHMFECLNTPQAQCLRRKEIVCRYLFFLCVQNTERKALNILHRGLHCLSLANGLSTLVTENYKKGKQCTHK